MAQRSDVVERFMGALDHPRRAEIAAIRRAILAADESITEQIKWKAPSFCWKGDDRVTFLLQPNNCLKLIFHRGAKKQDPAGFVFHDPGGMLFGRRRTGVCWTPAMRRSRTSRRRRSPRWRSDGWRQPRAEPRGSGTQARPCVWAKAAASVRLARPSLPRRWVMWVWAVRGLMERASPICRFERPAARRRRTSNSRGVST